MNKYIDADKLIVEIKRLDKENEELLKSGGSIGREFLFGIGAGYADIIKIITSLQQEQPMSDSTKLIELWHADKEMLKEKDFRNDPWRLAYNAFMCGFGRGLAVNKQ